MITRHRLPSRYRIGLAALWVTPLGLFVAVMISQVGFNPALLDPRFLLPALLMIAPALYFWQEGIDVLPDGIYRRSHVPRYYPFTAITRMQYDAREHRRVLTLWDQANQKIVECRAGHLTNFPTLLARLEDRLR